MCFQKSLIAQRERGSFRVVGRGLLACFNCPFGSFSLHSFVPRWTQTPPGQSFEGEAAPQRGHVKVYDWCFVPNPVCTLRPSPNNFFFVCWASCQIKTISVAMRNRPEVQNTPQAVFSHDWTPVSVKYCFRFWFHFGRRGWNPGCGFSIVGFLSTTRLVAYR